MLYDGTALIPDEDTVRYLPDLLPLRTFLEGDAEQEKQFQKENGKSHVYAPTTLGDIWRCSCGAINNEKEKLCHSCRLEFEKVLHPDLEGLKERRDIRVAAEEKRKKRRKKKAKQIAITAMAVALAITIIVTVFCLLILPALRYKQASRSYEAGDYQAAYELYKKNGSFKDSDSKAEEAKQKNWKSEYNRILTEGYEGYFTSGAIAGDESLFALADIDDDDTP